MLVLKPGTEGFDTFFRELPCVPTFTKWNRTTQPPNRIPDLRTTVLTITPYHNVVVSQVLSVGADPTIPLL